MERLRDGDFMASPYLTLGRLKQLAAENQLGDDAVILASPGSSIQISSTTNYLPELVVGWDGQLPRFWVRQELEV